VGESLIMTAIGLATAVPAVLGYNWLVRRNKLAVEKVRGFANDLHSVLVSGKVAGPQSTTIIRSEPAGARPLAAVRSA
jgi:biopolymer transport protein ExbB